MEMMIRRGMVGFLLPPRKGAQSVSATAFIRPSFNHGSKWRRKGRGKWVMCDAWFSCCHLHGPDGTGAHIGYA